MSDTITLSRQEYQDLIDARDHAVAMREIAAGVRRTVPEDQVDAYLASATPLAFWRRTASITQAAFAAEVGISQAYLSQIEAGHRTGDVKLYHRMAKALGLPMDDLVED